MEVDFTDIRTVRFDFDQRPSGALLIADIAFALEFSPGTLTLGLNQAMLRAGETLRVRLGIHHQGPSVTTDVYLGILLPDGVTAFFVTSLAPLDGVVTLLDTDPRPLPHPSNSRQDSMSRWGTSSSTPLPGASRPAPIRSSRFSPHQGLSQMARWMPGTWLGSRSNRSPSAREGAAWSRGAARSVHASKDVPGFDRGLSTC
jgi:hypothetical protein